MVDVNSLVRTVKAGSAFRKVALVTAKASRPVTNLSHRYGPEILTGAGIAGGVGTVILASRATLKLEGIVDKTKADILVAETRNDDKAARKARVDGIFAIAKLYTPTVTLGVASAGMVLGAHGIMKKRNVALAAAYKAIEQSFSEYRKRVVEEIGVEKEQDIRYGLRDEKIKDEETGKTKTVTHVDPSGISKYAVFFDDQSSSWSKTASYNLVFLRAQQNYANDMLQARGHLFLNEVYDMLGLPRTKAGQVVGWYLDLTGKGDQDGDGYVDFNIYNFDSTKARQFVNGQENVVLLDFNVDGLIHDKI